MREHLHRRVPMRALPAVVALLCVILSTVAAAGESELVARRIKGRPAKLLHQALYAKDGRLGFLHDVNHDGSDDFVHLVQVGSRLSFRIMSLLDAEPRVDVTLGKGYPAGLGMANLDDDDDLEFIAAYGSRRDRLTKKALLIAASVVTSAFVSAQTIPDTGVAYTFTYVAPPSGLDLEHLVAFDDDGAIIWRRDVEEKGDGGASWDNVRFRMLIPLAEEEPPVILLTNNVGAGVLGVSGADGSTLWRAELPGAIPPAKWATGGLVDDGTILPVLFVNNEMVVLNPRDGRVVLTGQFERPVSLLPSWSVFGDGEKEGFLVFGEDRGELRMVSLTTGATLWSLQLEKVRAVLPLDANTFMVVWRNGIKTLHADGTVLHEAETPFKVKTAFEPVFKDIDGDGSSELVFVSGKKVVCWNPRDGRVLWSESLASFVGGANPVALYDNFHDMNGDGWLDVPAATGGGAGRWLSGRTGEVIVTTGAAFENPLVGDWDRDGKMDLFWWNNWYEIENVAKK